MDNYIQRETAKLRRVAQFGEDHPLDPPNPAAAAEYTGVNEAIADVEAMAENQASGSGTKAGAVDQRLAVVDGLLNLMSSLSKAAKVLDKTIYPDVASKMLMGKFNSFEQLLAQANVFHSTLAPIEAQFIALGAPATVAADLQGMINALQGAGDLKFTGLDLQIGGTAGLKHAVGEGLQHVRKLDAILSQVYRNNPVVLAQWKAARRTERSSTAATAPEAAAVAGSGI
jgi:hypothetical protein